MTALDYGHECIINLDNGGSLRCDPYPDLTYVRVCNEAGDEVAYWTEDEWIEDPSDVIGAILGAAMHPVAV